MNEPFFKTTVFSSLTIALFAAVYLYGRKAHPQSAPWLCGITCLLMLVLTYYRETWLGASVVLSIAYLFALRKPDQRAAFQQFFAANNIYTTQQYSSAALDMLGDKKWTYAKGLLISAGGQTINYSFWQGSTSSQVSSGQYVRATTYTYYLAFIFPPGSISNYFEQRVRAEADKSNYTLRQKIHFFFVPDTERPTMVCNASDGSFIVEYITLRDVEHYKRRVDWIKENINAKFQPVISSSFTLN